MSLVYERLQNRPKNYAMERLHKRSQHIVIIIIIFAIDVELLRLREDHSRYKHVDLEI